MENRDCPYNSIKYTREDQIRGRTLLLCDYAKNKSCPYGNSESFSLGEGEPPITICTSEGLVRKLEKKEI